VNTLGDRPDRSHCGGRRHWLAISPRHETPLAIPVGRTTAIASFTLFATLLFGLPLLASATSDHTIELISSFYRSGSLVFGGGHVVLPLLQQAVVPRGWISNDAFLAGYGAAQSVPGPLFTSDHYV